MPAAYQLRIDLEGAKPPIWRRVLIPAHATFADLHDVIQATMPWDDYHLHEFELGTRNEHPLRIGMVDEDELDLVLPFDDAPIDERALRLDAAGLDQGDWFRYIYDFGDHWSHKIRLEKILDEPPGDPLPRLVKGRRRAPAEDSRGTAAEDPGDKLLDLKRLDERLEPIRNHIARTDAQAIAPNGLLWADEWFDVCSRCGGLLPDETHTWVLEAVLAWGPDYRENRRVAVDGLACPGCHLVTAPSGLLETHIARRLTGLHKIRRFRRQGRDLPTWIQRPGPRPDNQPGQPWSDFRDRMARADGPGPDWGEVDRLPRADGPFEALVRPIAWLDDAFEHLLLGRGPRLSYLVLVVDGFEYVRAAVPTFDGPPTAGDVTDAIRRAAAWPATEHIDPARPTTVHMEDPDAYEKLADTLADHDITLQQGPVDRAREAHDSFVESNPPPGHERALGPWWIEQDEAAIHAYFAAVDAFDKAEPWHRIPDDEWFAVRIHDGPWRYVNLMSPAEAEGDGARLAIASDWNVAQTLSNHDPEEDIRTHLTPSDALATIGYHHVTALHPIDADRLLRLGILQDDVVGLFTPVRLGSDGPGHSAVPLPEMTAILTAFADPMVQVGDDVSTRRIDVNVGPARLVGPLAARIETVLAVE